MLKEFWKDPVWSKVIASAIIGAITLIGTFLLDLWPTIGGKFHLVTTYLQNSTSVQNWILGLLILSSLPFLILILALAWHQARPNTHTKPAEKNWKLYVEDKFFGLQWRWDYLNNGISGLHTYCPHCDYQVYHIDTNEYGRPRIQFDCDCCHKHLGTFQEPYISLRSKVERFIDQKIRNESWGDNKGT